MLSWIRPRFRTDTTGTVQNARGTYPFGEQWYSTPTPSFLFATYAHDNESGNDYALARIYVSRLGRFSSPDPVDGSSSNPQSWNRYTYVLNNPINMTDSTGLDHCLDIEGNQSGEVGNADCEKNGGKWVISDDGCSAGTICTTVSGTSDQMPDMWINGMPAWYATTNWGSLGSNTHNYHTVAEWDDIHPRGGNSRCGTPPFLPCAAPGNSKASRLKSFNSCVDRASSVRNEQLTGTTAEIVTGGLVFVATGWVTIASGGAILHEMAADAASTAPESGFLLFSAATSDLPHVGLLATAATGGIALMAHGSAGELKALNQHDRAVADCQAQNGYPNVP